MPLKGLSFDEIVAKEIKAGKPQAQAVAIAYKTTGKKNEDEASLEEHQIQKEELIRKGNALTAEQRFDSLEMRSARGTQRYGKIK